MRAGGREVTWDWDGGVRQVVQATGETKSLGAGGAFGLLAIAAVAGVVSGVAEALGVFLALVPKLNLIFQCRSGILRRQLNSSHHLRWMYSRFSQVAWDCCIMVFLVMILLSSLIPSCITHHFSLTIYFTEITPYIIAA